MPAPHKGGKMKTLRYISVVFVVFLSVICSASLTSCGNSGDVEKFYVYNWGEYIDEDLLPLFEQYYEETYGQKIKLIYNTFASNEVMYSKLTGGSADIDLIIPSDYMIDRLRHENMLAPLNFDNIPAVSGILIPGMEGNPVYDPDGLYTVPYTYGTVGLIYNPNLVDSADFEGDVSWRILLDPKYSGNMLMFNNSRDAFAVAQYILSYEYVQKNGLAKDYINSENEADWREALAILQQQKPLLQAYVMDEVFNTMEGGTAAIAPYYAGDFLTMKEANEDLEFCYPVEGTNLFVDAMCIPKNAAHKEIAERFINFMISTDIEVGGESYNPALQNANYICYATPVTAVRECDETYIDEETGEECYVYECYGDEYLYADLPTTYTFSYLSEDMQIVVSDLWDELKIDTTISPVILIISLLIVAGTTGLLLYNFIVKRRRARYY